VDISEFDYDLPDNLIAQEPLAERDASLTKSHSVEEAEARHQSKSGPRLSK